MTDPHSRAGVARPDTAFWWLRGRAGRREYWACIAAIFLVSLVVQRAGMAADLVVTFVQVGIQIRRLHDFNRSGWWAIVALALALVAVVAGYYATGFEDPGLAAAAIVVLGTTVGMGAVAGTPGDNRFGPQPPFTARRVLTGR